MKATVDNFIKVVKLFTLKDDLRPVLQYPYVSDGLVRATTGAIAIEIDNCHKLRDGLLNYCDEQPPKFPDFSIIMVEPSSNQTIYQAKDFDELVNYFTLQKNYKDKHHIGLDMGEYIFLVDWDFICRAKKVYEYLLAETGKIDLQMYFLTYSVLIKMQTDEHLAKILLCRKIL